MRLAAAPLAGRSRRQLHTLLVANRGEIAVRILRAAAELDVRTVAVYEPADEASLHVALAGQALAVPSYLDTHRIVSAAAEAGCDMLHPGYGFLSESAGLADACDEAGISFVGPTASTIRKLGDKVAARQLAQQLGVPTAAGSAAPCDSPAGVRAAMAGAGIHYPVMLKAVGGGGGRGMRPVARDEALDEAFAACQRECAAVGLHGGVFVEELLPAARHIEVQLLGDGAEVVHLYERDCSVQRRRQKQVETSPARNLPSSLRERLFSDALAIGSAVGYRSAGTVEFLVAAGPASAPAPRYVFLEANPRIQVEHTVSEEATGVDLVRATLQIAAGETLRGLGLAQESIRVVAPAIQARVAMTAPGGRLASFAEPGGAGVRCDGALYAGYSPPSQYDPLLVKIIARGAAGGHEGAEVPASSWEVVRRRLLRACSELHLGGTLQTNLADLRAILASGTFARGGEWTTELLDDEEATASALGTPSASSAPSASLAHSQLLDEAFGGGSAAATAAAGAEEEAPLPEGCSYVRAPVAGRVLDAAEQDCARPGELVGAGASILVLSSMKMEVPVGAPASGRLLELLAQPGSVVELGQPVALLRHAEGAAAAGAEEAVASGGGAGSEVDAGPRPDLARVLERRFWTTDEGRASPGGDPKFAARVAGRAERGQRTARQNIEALVDAGSLFEYGRYAVAAQRGRRKLEELERRTPADGLVTGVASVNGGAGGFSTALSKAAVVAYDATVLAGTQGYFNHAKLDRMLALAEQQRLPLLLLAEGGGGRPGDVDIDPIYNSQLAVSTFRQMGRLSGRVPLVGVASGFCFAGNAALLGMCDVVIATEGANIGMAGPAMVAGGGLGQVAASAIGPSAEQARNGVVDLLAADDAEATALARRYLGFFQGPLPPPATFADQRLLRAAVPENRKRAFAVRPIIETLVDESSWLELRREFGRGLVSGLARVDGRPIGVIANSSAHLGGAIDSDGALKAARFMELCDAFDVPLLFLCDTPGFMVGPESERGAAVRKMSRLFAVGSSLSVPFFTLVLRRAYGLGAMAMSGGLAVGPNVFHASWPSAEAGPMGLEGAIELGFAKELAAAGSVPLVGEAARRRLHESLLHTGLERAGATSVARTLETDDVIDPADSRAWIVHGLDAAAVPAERGDGGADAAAWRTRRDGQKRRPCVSPW